MIKKYRKILGSHNRKEYFKTLSQEEKQMLLAQLNENESNEMKKILKSIKRDEMIERMTPYRGCQSCGNCSVILLEEDVERVCNLGYTVNIELNYCPNSCFKPKEIDTTAVIFPITKTYFETQQ